MKKTQETLQVENIANVPIMYIAFELSAKNWKLAFSNGDKVRYKSILAGDLVRLQEEIQKAKLRFQIDNPVRTVSCYEAGRDGFWLHRYLISSGTENLIVDSSSIEVNRRKRRAKTDRIDVSKLLRMLIRHHDGEKGLWSIVHVPSMDDEDARHLNRELNNLKKERTIHRNRIRGFLIQHGLKVSNPSRRYFLKELETLRQWDSRTLPIGLKSRVVREYNRLRLVEDQISTLEKEKKNKLMCADTVPLRKIAQLQLLHGIGTVSSWAFVNEFFGWRNFKNRREVAGLSGLAPTPYDSGDRVRNQGISKAGSARIRTLAIELSWTWLRFQPHSKLSRWYIRRFASGGKRMRRIGIVAMARRLLIDLWRYLEYGIVPEGARLRLVK